MTVNDNYPDKKRWPSVTNGNDRAILALQEMGKETGKEPIFRDVHSQWIDTKPTGDRWKYKGTIWECGRP
jgi:hypothetical protein